MVLHEGEIPVDAALVERLLAQQMPDLPGLLHQAVLIVLYCARSNPGFVATARRTIEQVLAVVGG
ncbi:hypothetical protein [Quadrisphaera sp. DSM 44207]|uniref:hypothetical protein n=1 Tax=Quadrisphaera sp. DSM 44207 TaxID=1881057 RepID=UPI0008895535|nr:hypothetical protein [Quadrisphaera sp. DSM 44207]SDQ12288.1 hypothetical protein SAMN05428996_0652 [Quadrisphaera sp. DSM 44207]